MHESNPHIARARLLISQHRFDLAEPHVRQALALDPNDDRAHAWLALCLREREAFTEATMEARTAVGLAPDDGYPQYVLSTIFEQRNMPKEALAAIKEALRLDPAQADYWGHLAALHTHAKNFRDGLEAAERGLQLDPESTLCTNMRALALRALGRKDDAADAVATTLARNPEDAISHANMGWNLLHQSKPKEALIHFREALRLRPDLEWARNGIVEALKARWLPYRLILRYFLFMSRLKGRAQWLIIVGAYLGYQAIKAVSNSNPNLTPYLRPILWGYIAFAVSTWLAIPLFNLILRTSRFGRLVLSRRETIAANCLGVSLLLPAAVGAYWLWKGSDAAMLVAALLLPQIPAVAMAGLARHRRTIIIMCCWAGLVELYTAAMIALAFIIPGNSKPIANLYEAAILPLVIMGFGSVWVANIASSFREPRKN
jgi:tetratricopeptide (TPR) repeat protein